MTDAATHRTAPLEFLHPAETGRVSCIVPVYQGERFVAEAVESILAQTVPPREVLVVDDGSTDATPEVLAGFGDRIRVLRQDNQGPAAARNLGIAHSRGAFLAFLDADDLWIPDKLERQLAAFEARPELEICSAHIKSFWIPELDHERARFEDHPYHRERPMFSPCTVLVRRSVFERVGGFDPRLRNGEDTDWFVRAMRSDAVMDTIPLLMVHRRHHLGNLTRKVRPSPEGLLAHLKRALDRERAG